MLRHLRRLAIAAGITLTLLVAPVAVAATSQFRRLAASTVTFSSDGVRYAAWQVREGDPIVVLDTRTGHRSNLMAPAGCELENQASSQEPVAGAGGFLLNCYRQHESEQEGILDTRTGATNMLPEGPSGFSWHRAGQRYAEGAAGGQTCQYTKRHRGPGELCVALYDLVTGAIIHRAAWQVPDLDRPGAPPVCRGLRHEVLVETNRDAGLPRLWSYANGVFVHAEVLSRLVHLERCHGRSILLHGDGEVKNFDARGGLLTWDTGWDPENGEPAADASHATVTSYRLPNGKRRSWPLPSLLLHEYPQNQRGVFGYSTHTADTVFWIAARTIGYAAEGKASFVETSSVFSARL
jgi:hypothetical protein